MENNNINDLMKSLSELYAKKDYKGAVQFLEQNSQVLDSGTYAYNLGTLKAKLGDYAQARFYFEKALKDGYRSEALLNNLNFVKSKIQSDDLSNSSSLQDRIQDGMLLTPISLLLLFSVSLFFLSTVWMRWQKTMRVWKLIVMVLISFSPVILKVTYFDKKPVAIVLKDTEIYEGPSSIFEQKGTLKAGAKIRLSKNNGKWSFVSAPESSMGWIMNENFGQF